MQLKVNALDKHLKQKELAPCYLISGDDSFLCEEACAAIKACLEKRGFTREHHVYSPSYSWQTLEDSLNHMDLFSDSTYIELQHPSAKFDVEGSRILKNFLENPPSDKTLIIVTEKLTPQQRKGAWYKAIEKDGVAIAVWPLKDRELLAWLKNKMTAHGLNADHQSLALLAQFSSGNLFSANNAIRKLALWKPNRTVTVDAVRSVLCNHASYNPFEWVDNLMLGAAARALYLLDGMRETNQEITLILWSITNELRTLYSLAQAISSGQSQAQALKQHWQSKQMGYQKALRRLNRARIREALQTCMQIDLMIKGQHLGCPWQAMERLSMGLCEK